MVMAQQQGQTTAAGKGGLLAALVSNPYYLAPAGVSVNVGDYAANLQSWIQTYAPSLFQRLQNPGFQMPLGVNDPSQYSSARPQAPQQLQQAQGPSSFLTEDIGPSVAPGIMVNNQPQPTTMPGVAADGNSQPAPVAVPGITVNSQPQSNTRTRARPRGETPMTQERGPARPKPTGLSQFGGLLPKSGNSSSYLTR